MDFTNLSKKATAGIQILLSLVWLVCLRSADAYFSVYLITAAIGSVCLFLNYKQQHRLRGWAGILAFIFSGVFSLSSVLANHAVFWNLSLPFTLLSLLGGMVPGWNILLYLVSRFPQPVTSEKSRALRPRTIFFGCLFLLAAVDLLYLFLIDYPGTLTPDSMSQLRQLTSGVYSNHHPVWHTFVIKFWVETGYALFGNYNAAVALYHVWQIFFLASCFSYVIVTLYQAGVPKGLLLGSFVAYLVMPYHIAFSVTMWKDVVFAGAVLLFVTSLYRILRKIGKCQTLNYILFTIAGICFGIWRSNGWLASLASFLLCFWFLFKKEKKTVLLWAVALVMSWAMKGPFLASLEIPQPDLVESLSIPVQQTARALLEGCQLTEEETELLERIVDIEEIPDLYLSFISDPIKDEIRSKDSAYFEAHAGDYLKLWIKIGLRNPGAYIRAWIDQTKGYWNGGYEYSVMDRTDHRAFSNEFGLDQSIHETALSQGVWDLFQSILRSPVFQVFFSIGFHVWIMAFLCMHNLLRRRKEAMLAIPVLMIIGTLLVATPVSYEFRYAYAVFTTLPLVLPVSLYGSKEP